MLGVGCGVADEHDDPAQGERTEGDADEAGSAHPFAGGPIPDGYRLVAAGRGTQEQQWGTEMGFDGAYTAIEVAGRTVVAGIVPWEPMESSLQWASFSGDENPETFVLDDGRAAAYGEGTGGRWDDLLIEVGPTEALRIAAPNATRQELVEISARVMTNGERDASPVTEGRPEDWAVLGSVGVDTSVALRAQAYPSSNVVPGPASSYGMGWAYTGEHTQEGSPGSLSVMVLPGDDADLAALEVNPRNSAEEPPPPRQPLELEGRPAVLVSGWALGGGEVRSLVTDDETGALVVVTAYGAPMPTDDELVAVAKSVRPVDPSEWEQTEIAAFGGPGLNPDEGESEISRGEVDGIEWLLQTRTYKLPPDAEGATGPDTYGPLGPTSVTVDTCLKLSTRERACGAASLGGPDGSLYVRGEPEAAHDGVDFPPFLLVVSSQRRAEVVRLRAGDTTVEAPLHPVPGGDWDNSRAGVLMAEVPEGRPIPVCNPDPPPMEPPEGLTVARVDLYDAAGERLGCAGI